MSKKLEDMSLEELWLLFPIILRPYNEDYAIWYREEAEKLEQLLGTKDVVRLSHIGSTAVEGIISKPTIDILMEITKDSDVQNIINTLAVNGWIVMSKADIGRPEMMISLNQGYTPEGYADRVYHLHIRYHDDWDELYFRDYLNDNIDVANRYEKLKIELSHQYKYNRDKYTSEKTEFINEYSKIAREKYVGRYTP